MGVIRKKIAARGGEGGVKYVCDVCSADITSTVRVASPCRRGADISAFSVWVWRTDGHAGCLVMTDGPWSHTLTHDFLWAIISGDHYILTLTRPRYALDVRALPATSTTCASNASPAAHPAMPTSRQHIHSASSNRIRSPYSTQNGVRTRSCCSSKEPRSTD